MAALAHGNLLEPQASIDCPSVGGARDHEALGPALVCPLGWEALAGCVVAFELVGAWSSTAYRITLVTHPDRVSGSAIQLVLGERSAVGHVHLEERDLLGR